MSQIPAVGTAKADIDTPALCLDLDQFESNIAAVAGFCREHGVDWRPHAKCHKSSVIGRQLVEAGALGLTCAKLGEAEVMARGGIQDLLIANLIVGKRKVERLVELRRIADPIVCVDHPDQVGPIAEAMTAAGLELRMIIEIDIGLGRVGAQPGEAVLQLARLVHQTPGVVLAGIMGYEGHLLALEDLDEKERRIREALDILAASQKQLLEQDLPCPLVSCGGTGSYLYSTRHPGITEVQAGGAIFMDRFYRERCRIPDLGFALSVVVTVVSRPAPDRAIVDAGRKTINGEIALPKVKGREDIRVTQLSAEHGALELDPSAQDLRIGDRLELIPGYGDLTTVLHNHFLGFRGDRLEAVWPLEARGLVQ